MNIAFLISFYDEPDIVFSNIERIKKLKLNSYIGLVQSENQDCDNNTLNKCKSYSNDYKLLPDLSVGVPNYAYQAEAIARNYSCLFNAYYNYCNKHAVKYDSIVCLTGDTLLYDIANIEATCLYLKTNEKKAAISQAIGQCFNSADDNMIDKFASRYQHDSITDLMPQFFIVDGDFAMNTKLFEDIKVTNKWTSEQCLGDSLNESLNKINSNIVFHDHVIRLNEANVRDAYSYKGVKYHAKNGRPGR